MTFTVMTFNVRGSFHDDGANDWNQRSDLNIATIHRYAPDILGIQEAQQGNLDDYARALGRYAVEPGPLSIRQTERYHRVPIYWNSTRFEKIESGSFYLSETPDEWSIGWDTTLVRAVNWVKLQENTSRDEFVVLNTHFPHERDAEDTRAKCAELIVRQLAQLAPDCPHIVMANFNTQPTSMAHQVFMEHGYEETYMDTEALNTFHGFQGEAFEWQSGRIDWILTKDAHKSWRCVSFEMITDAEPPIYPSDHYPMMAELDLV